MSNRNDVPSALIDALLAAGLAGSKAIDGSKSRPIEGKREKANERFCFGSRSAMPPSREVVSWALRQLSDLASDREA
jgi:hypothetical protein